jgi:Protein of unknown function (DUF2459)
MKAAPGNGARTSPSLSRRTLLAAGCTAALAGCSATRSATQHEAAKDTGDPRSQAVHLVARGWHTDVDLPAARLPAPLHPLASDFPGATHFLFGFGERAYWTHPDPTSTDALAALLPGPGVILATALRVPPEAAFASGDVVTLPVTEAGLDRLAAHLASELRENGEFRRLADGPYPGSRFYATSRRYSAVYTCNTWTADAAQVAGTGVSASGILFAGQLMERARAVAARRRSAAAERLAPPERGGYTRSASTRPALGSPNLSREPDTARDATARPPDGLSIVPPARATGRQ